MKQNIDKQVEITQLKKFYSEFQTGMKMYIANEGCSDMTCTGLFDNHTHNGDGLWISRMKTEMKKIFKLNQDYGFQNGAGPLAAFYTKFLGDEGRNNLFHGFYSILTVDGYLIGLIDVDVGNCSDRKNNTVITKLNGNCAVVYVDVNGLKAPNTWGRDVYIFMLSNDGLLFPMYGMEMAKLYSNTDNYSASGYYWKNDSTLCGTHSSSEIAANVTGMGCSARIMDSGWVMDY